jgi:hypothetical protein
MRTSFATCFGIATICAVTSSAHAGLLAPDATVAGISQAEWGDRWWQWAISYPTASNPIVDPTGAFSHLGNQGPVFFLAGSFGDPVTRSVTVGENQYLFIPFVNVISIEPYNGTTEAELRQDAADTLGVVSNLSISLDGSPMPLPPSTPSLQDFQQLSPPGTFNIIFPADNVYGLDPATYPAVAIGYWAMIGPLSLGNHVLHLTARSDGTGAYTGLTLVEDITYDIKAVPEPASGFSLLLGIVVGGVAIGRKRWPRNSPVQTSAR